MIWTDTARVNFELSQQNGIELYWMYRCYVIYGSNSLTIEIYRMIFIIKILWLDPVMKYNQYPLFHCSTSSKYHSNDYNYWLEHRRACMRLDNFLHTLQYIESINRKTNMLADLSQGRHLTAANWKCVKWNRRRSTEGTWSQSSSSRRRPAQREPDQLYSELEWDVSWGLWRHGRKEQEKSEGPGTQ